MAEEMGEAVGETVGYRVRLDRRIGPRTRIESVTTGLFLRQLQGDPELKASPRFCSTNFTNARSTAISRSRWRSNPSRACGPTSGSW
jgi:hypothetical protein